MIARSTEEPEKEATTREESPIPTRLNNVIKIDDERTSRLLKCKFRGNLMLSYVEQNLDRRVWVRSARSQTAFSFSPGAEFVENFNSLLVARRAKVHPSPLINHPTNKVIPATCHRPRTPPNPVARGLERALVSR